MDKLKRLYLSGYKSFRYDPGPVGPSADTDDELRRSKTIEFGDITVVLGANGAGKSNLVSFFKMLNYMTAENLQGYVGLAGTSNSLLHYGRKVTPSMQAKMDFEIGGHSYGYVITLSDAAPDTLIFLNEVVLLHQKGCQQSQKTTVLGTGTKESLLKKFAETGDGECRGVYGMLRQCEQYQFLDTSPTALIRKSGYIEDAVYLRPDGGNLAAYLWIIRKETPDHYERIVRTIQLAFPQFDDFVLEPSPLYENNILLNWREKGWGDYLFGPHQLSDGTLRFMALATLFLQPPDKLPSVIIIDEPELGLHPYAITVLASMINSAAEYCQVILATQSTRLVDEFDLDQIVVVERDEKRNCSRFHKPDVKALEDWIERYSTSELWEKNVLGGRP